ncbi:exported hypothetical protein [Xanthomonas citri pv. citri]|nr:exported hypothetical protein [Xanthomonas citri pv. citri]CEH39390.1 exported hypothetical protein [Xanthomonas citri pv. citri]
MQFRTTSRKTPVTLLALSIGLALSGQAAAQDAAQSPAEPAVDLDTVTVTGYRASVEKALDIKRGEAGVVDAIVAEDIGKFPDLNLAESLQRIPGVVITRDAGEGRAITVRGLGPEFTRVRINGMEALTTVGAGDQSGGTNRGRGFDFNVFASDLFSQLIARKTASADVEEGSLGAHRRPAHRAPVRLQRLYVCRQWPGGLQRHGREGQSARCRVDRQYLGRQHLRRLAVGGLHRAAGAGRRLQHRPLGQWDEQRQLQCGIAICGRTLGGRVPPALPALCADGTRPAAPGRDRVVAVEAHRPHHHLAGRAVLQDRRHAR